MDIWSIVLIVAFALTCFYFYITWNNNYWNKHGVPNEKPVFFFGNFTDVFKGTKHFGVMYSDLYSKFKNSLYVGVYKLRSPAILIRDPELIKNVMVKDFPHFPSNDFKVDPEVDPIFATHVFAQTGEEWRKNRSAWTTSVTSSKVKNTFEKLNEKCDIMIEFIKNNIKEKPNEPLEPRELSSNFFTDAVVSAIFGLEIDSFKTKDNPYQKIIKSFFIPTFLEGLVTVCFIAVPWLAKLLKLRFVPKHVERELHRLADEILKNRQITGFQKTNSFDSILLHERNKNSLTRTDVAGLILGFLIDGTETSSGSAGFMIYALAANPHVQNKLRAELDQAANANDGKLDYDTIHSLQYLDMVLSETLRLYPPGLHIQRLCVKDYALPPPYPGGKPYTIKEGMTVVVPIYGLQMDPEYFPEPEKFDPERFNEENKRKIVKYSYLPFGEGPRVCLGARFALNQTKIEIANIIRNFEIRLAPKMQGISIEIDPNVLVMRAIGGLWVTFHNRTDQ